MPSENHAATAVDRFQSRLPASLYEVAWQYSLFDWYSAMQSGDIDWDLAPEHLAYLTPRAKSSLFGEDDSLVVVYADCSDPDAPVLRSDEDGGPVEITTYTEADRFRVGHAYPENKTSSMTDYSITTHKGAEAHHIAGLRDDAWWTNNVQDRFTDWAASEYADAVRDRVDDADAAILEALAALGEDDEAMDRLADALLTTAGGEDVELDALITVRVRLPGEDRYRYPGEVPVLNEVMVEKKADRLQSISVDDASGDGVGYVTGEPDRVTGGSPGLFGTYGKKQREHFPDIDPTGASGWRIHPLDFDIAAAIAAAGSIFEDFYRGLGNNRRLYVLPYLATRAGDLDPSTFEWFYESVFTRLREADTGQDGTFDDVVETVMRQAADATDESDEPFADVGSTAAWEQVRFAVVFQVTGNPDRVFFDTLDAGYRPAGLEDAHNRATGSPVFEGEGIFATYPSPESSPLLGVGLELHRYILYGGYFDRTTEPTRTSRQASETPTAGDIDDTRMQRVRRFLTGEPLRLEPLLEQYVHKLVQDQRDLLDDDSKYVFPKRSVVEQYVQLRALTDDDALTAATEHPLFTTTAMSTDAPETRTDRLEQFLDEHHTLHDDARQAVFLLGGLVGRITAYQSREGVSSTLVRRYPVDYLTKQTVKEVTKEVLQMDNSYAEADDRRNYWTNSRYTTRLSDTMLVSDPEEWTLTEAELQWLYSLGITYGLNDTSTDAETDAAAATADT
jgi:hypothetical protein